MKKSLSLVARLTIVMGFALLTFSAFAQVQATKCQCSYFMPFFWEFSYPGMFQAQIDPATETITVTPLSNNFKGIVSIAVFESINCGDEPVCAYSFDAPVSGLVQLPEGFTPCALDASPLFLKLCWRRKVEFPSLQMAAVAW